MGDRWRRRRMSGMWAPYPGERPFSLKLPSVACSSDKMRVIWDYSTFFSGIIRNDTIQMLHATVV